MIVFAPEISPWQSRLFFVVSIFILLLILYSIHSKLIPNTYILLEEKRFETWERAWPSILSFVMTVSSSVLALFLFNYFSN